MRAYLKFYRQSPRKTRLVAKELKGKSVAYARVFLQTVPKRAAEPLAKLLNSAVANAKDRNTGIREEDLTIEGVRVDKGATLKRYTPRARGAAYHIRKRTSNVILTLAGNTDGQSEKI